MSLKVESKYKIIEESLRKSKKIKVIFLLINVDSWKLDSVYNAFKNNNRYEATVVVCPFTSKGNAFLSVEMAKSKLFCKAKEYEYFVAYDEVTGNTIDAKQELEPDIVFFSNPNALTSSKLLFSNFSDILTCYVPYSFRIDTLYQYSYDCKFVNSMWINFYESPMHKQLAEQYAKNKGVNVVSYGFPFMDNYIENKHLKSVWISSDKKRIIWAPHWTIKGGQDTGLDWACFLIYHEPILSLAKEFEADIEIAIKPHPFLMETLSKEELWGRDKTVAYFDKWANMDNCHIVNGDYIDLFMSSDALIHDSGSFMTEYLALNKQVAYTVNAKDISKRFNEFGGKVLTGHQLIHSTQELRSFILNVINGDDPLSERRKEIIDEENLMTSRPISENILQHIDRILS